MLRMPTPQPQLGHALRDCQKKIGFSYHNFTKFFLMILGMGALTPQFAQAADSFPSEGDPTVCSEFVEFSKIGLASQQSMVNLIKVWFRQVQPDEIQIQEARERILQKANPFYEGTSVVAQQLRNAGDQILQKNSELNWDALLTDFETLVSSEKETKDDIEVIDTKAAMTPKFIETDSILPEDPNASYYKDLYSFQESGGKTFVTLLSRNFEDPVEPGGSRKIHLHQFDPIDGKFKNKTSITLTSVKEQISVPIDFVDMVPPGEVRNNRLIFTKLYHSGQPSIGLLDIENQKVEFYLTPNHFEKNERLKDIVDLGNNEIFFSTENRDLKRSYSVFYFDIKNKIIKKIGQVDYKSSLSYQTLKVDPKGNISWFILSHEGILSIYSFDRETLQFDSTPVRFDLSDRPRGSMYFNYLPIRETWAFSTNMESGEKVLYEYDPKSKAVNILLTGNSETNFIPSTFSILECENKSIYLATAMGGSTGTHLGVYELHPETQSATLVTSQQVPLINNIGQFHQAPYFTKNSDGRIYLVSHFKDIDQKNVLLLHGFDLELRSLLFFDSKTIDANPDTSLRFIQQEEMPLNIIGFSSDDKLMVIQVPF